MNKKWLYVALFCILALVLASCTPGTNELVGKASAQGEVHGFWRGLWNGMTVPLTFIISLFTKTVQIYEVHNNGNWYNFGYFLGLGIAFGGGAGSAASRRRRR